MKHYGGIDLHSNNNYLGILDEDNKKVYKKKLPNELSEVLRVLKPYKKKMEGIVVESTFNWYWLVDGLMEHGYKVHLANPSAIKQYEGLKHSDDARDAFHLAELLKLDILPEGYIYPKEQRPVRDLLRKRSQLVRQRTMNILSFKNLVSRNLGKQMSSNAIKKLMEEDVEDIFQEEHLIIAGKANIATIRFLTERIKEVEKAVLKKANLRDEYKILLTASGIGIILSLTIMLETGDITRFPSVGNYISYCRCVRSSRISNGKSKGEGNSKNGNKYLSWAYVEAANYAIRDYAYVRRYYQ
ncbi:MAG: IS110 family transposase, partial [Thermodesulfovibrionales bacterium]|nr:IS110 family transposase [Thermodesulfovibrionales bacterium]